MDEATKRRSENTTAILLLCARTHLDEAGQNRLRELIAGDVDWIRLDDLASRHCVLSLLFWNLNAAGWGAAPDDWRRDLQEFFHSNTARNFVLTRELLRITQLFSEREIAFVSFKGPTLAQAVYGNVALRQFGDLDVLVGKRDILRARQVLLDDGYQSRIALTPAQEAAHLRDDSVFDLVRHAERLPLELHWAITSRCFARPVTLEHLRPRLQSRPLANGATPQIDAENLLLILCVHGTKHTWERLSWICDVAELLRGQTMDWKRVFGLARQFRVERMVALGLLVAHETLQAPLPDDVLKRLKSQSTVCALAAQVRSHLFEADKQGGVESDWFLLRSMDAWRDRVGFAWHLATAPSAEERAALRLPPYLEWVRPAVRPTRLMARFGARALTSLRPSRTSNRAV